MASPLFIVNPESNKKPISVAELLSLMDSDHLDQVEQQMRTCREDFKCPTTVRDHHDYRKQLFAFAAHYYKRFYGSECKPTDPDETIAAETLYWQLLQPHYKGDLRVVEKNAIHGRDGGFIGIIDAITDGLVKARITLYLDMILFDYIPRDDQLRMRLAQELLRRYGTLLFPNEELVPDFMLVYRIEEVLKSFAMNLHSIRREWRG